ncbi:MAG: ribosome biogenesis GTP-binding protein YihA/YsxC [Thermodesulfobacteriota bacterium]|nr:ribosome biogenesis GTP-binding protein YihA/YsxC [Thermodesulfobacteriota bacterium]
MIIKSAEFIKSATAPDQYPETALPEIAFAGRSNVGKSSLINCLVNRKNLVKTSSTPGKTRLINFFRINDEAMFVDLPGYGYAKVSKQEKKKWGPMVETYLADRPSLMGVMLLMDIRRQPREDEFLMAQWLSHYEIPGTIILTKADKLKKQARQKQLSVIARDFDLPANSFILFSSKTGMGREDVMGVIEHLIMQENDD